MLRRMFLSTKGRTIGNSVSPIIFTFRVTMKLRTLRDIPQLQGRRVLLRAGLDVSVGSDDMVDPAEAYRIEAILPTFRYLLQNGAKVIVVAKRGRPEGKRVSDLSLSSVAKYLESRLQTSVRFCESFNWAELEKVSRNMQPGEILMLENIRFLQEELDNSPELGRKLAQIGDIYVAEDFPVIHREQASVVQPPQFLPAFAGLRLQKEVSTLQDIFERPAKPLVLMLAGIKMGSKVEVLQRFWDVADHICLGGVLANTFLHVKGIAVGASVVSPESMESLKGLPVSDTKLHLPVDAVVSDDPEGGSGARLAPVGRMSSEELILDIGPDTIEMFKNIIDVSETVAWNGPMGKTELPEFREGTIKIGRYLAESSAFSLVGGGDSTAALAREGLLDKFDFASTGGGAMLELLAGNQLPGLQALYYSNNN